MDRAKKKEVFSTLKKYNLTTFQTTVLSATYDIPRGEVRTYKQIAESIGHPRSYRAVGSALKINPMAPTIPCHRVIRSNGELGNYSAPGGTRKKRQMLKNENAI